MTIARIGIDVGTHLRASRHKCRPEPPFISRQIGSHWGATHRLIRARRHLLPRDTGPITWRTDSPLIRYENDRIWVVANPSNGSVPLGLDHATWSTTYDTENAQTPTTVPRVLASLQAIGAVRTDER